MIEDKEKGIKIAENKEEAIWTKVVAAREQAIEQLKEAMIIEKAFLEKAKVELKKAQNKQ